jgi:hypothetical protein
MAPRILTASLFAATTVLCVACGTETLKDGSTWHTTIAGQPFNLTVSSSDATRQRGLGGVADIAKDGGMVFVFPDSELRAFWMKDCITDMDIVYLDPLGYVTAVRTMKKESLRHEGEPQADYEARLPRYSSVAPAQYVIELRVGRANELGIKPQQKLPVDAEALKAALR